MLFGESGFSEVTLGDDPGPPEIVGAIVAELYTQPAIVVDLEVDSAITVQLSTQPDS